MYSLKFICKKCLSFDDKMKDVNSFVISEYKKLSDEQQKDIINCTILNNDVCSIIADYLFYYVDI